MTWPKGEDGDLIVFPDQTVTIDAGEEWDYESITVKAGGILEISAGSRWTRFGCRRDMVVHGLVRAQLADYPSPRSIKATARDGYVISADVSVAAGGAGGHGYHSPRKSAHGGSPAFGNGGGGGSHNSIGGNAIEAAGGQGAIASWPPPGPSDSWLRGAGGRGGTLSDLPGQAGESVRNTIPGNHALGGGGGGGSRGFHGALLYFHVLGNVDISGKFDLGGIQGGRGGDGGNAEAPKNASVYGGGGGGGGAGGSGGHLIIRHKGTFTPGLIDVTGGAGGPPGNPGSSRPKMIPPQPTAGSAGHRGVDGSIQIIDI